MNDECCVNECEEPRPELSVIAQSLEQQEKSIVALNDAVSILVRRIEPIMRPVETAENGNKTVESIKSPVNSQITSNTNRIDDLRYTIDQVTKLIEL